MPSQIWWKNFYADERAAMSRSQLERMVLDCRVIELTHDGAIIFPHTRLISSGKLVAAAARAVIESGCDTVLAIGVLHGVSRGDASQRGIHGPGAPIKSSIWRDEFSLDNFSALLAIASELTNKRMPRIIARYPFLAGADPESLSGFGELQTFVDDGAALVATGDLVHHGAGYGTPKYEQLYQDDASTISIARGWIEEQCELLARAEYAAFIEKAEAVRSDFRDAGPVLAALASNAKYIARDLALVDYADVLEAEEPTWVAAAIAELKVSIT